MAYINGKEILFSAIIRGIGEGDTAEEWDGTGVVITPIGHEEPEENTFTFTVSDETYTAENDMNWYQWANSNYCNETSSCEGEESKVYIRTKTLILDLEGKAVIGGEVITKGGKYLSIIEQEDEGNTFTINGTSYQMDNRMTWYAWTRSDYNTDGFSCENENSYVYEAESKNVVTDAKGIEVLGTNYISEGGAYLIKEAVTEDELAGTWVLGSGFSTYYISYEWYNTYNVNFTSNGNSYNQFRIIQGSEFDSDDNLRSIISYGNNGSFTSVFHNSGRYTDYYWVADGYKTIHITSKLAEVENGEYLLALLKQEATKQ